MLHADGTAQICTFISILLVVSLLLPTANRIIYLQIEPANGTSAPADDDLGSVWWERRQ